VRKAKDILSGIAHAYKNKDKVLHAYEEQEESAMQGFGSIMKDTD
jgi:hypothetical protein